MQSLMGDMSLSVGIMPFLVVAVTVTVISALSWLWERCQKRVRGPVCNQVWTNRHMVQSLLVPWLDQHSTVQVSVTSRTMRHWLRSHRMRFRVQCLIQLRTTLWVQRARTRIVVRTFAHAVQPLVPVLVNALGEGIQNWIQNNIGWAVEENGDGNDGLIQNAMY